MKTIKVSESDLMKAASESMNDFVAVFINAINKEIDGQLTAETMKELSSSQITLLAWSYLQQEVMDGGYVQLIYNGYGRFFFNNPVAIAFKTWGLHDLYKHLMRVRPIYLKYRKQIENDCSDDDFMALFEQMPEFDDYDDEFVDHEEDWEEEIAHYIDEHLEEFAIVEKEMK